MSGGRITTRRPTLASKVNYVDPICDDGSCRCSPESCWTKFAAMQQPEREREHPFDEASSCVYDPVYGSKYSLPTDEEEAQQSQEVLYSPKLYETEEPRSCGNEHKLGNRFFCTPFLSGYISVYT